MDIQVENIKCGGCVQSIVKKLKEVEGVEEVLVDRELELVHIEGSANREELVKMLSALGYPEKGSNTAFHKVKSYVSCAVGKLSES